jgi:hypothetical protein
VSATTDAALTLFFQIESTSSGGAFSCADAEVVYCARSWTLPEAGGAAGSCFFILPAGRSFTCTATGGAVNLRERSGRRRPQAVRQALRQAVGRRARSDHGHDGFLIESAAVGELVRETLRLAERDLQALTGP